MANEKTPAKKPIAQIREENLRLHDKVEKLQSCAYCGMCDSLKLKSKFYSCTDPKIKGGVTRICKECARKIAHRTDQYGREHDPTMESVILALRYLDKPFIMTVWNSSIQESENLASGKIRSTAWLAYVKNISMGQYNGLTFKDSDMFKERIVYEDEKTEKDIVEEHAGMDTYDSFIKNKMDVIRLLDYDPFEKEAVGDQPFLYSQLLGMLDASEDANEDMMRVSSAIQIARGFLQLQKIDDTISTLMGDIKRLQENSATIKTLQDSKQRVTSMITNLAAESCLSLKNSKSKTKGENTFSGKLRKIRELNLRDYELNGFSIETCKGIQQVADASMQAIINGLKFTEDEMAEIVAEQRKSIGKLTTQAKSYKEAFRILLKENLDLRDTLESQGGLDKDSLVDLDELVGSYIISPEKEATDG